MKDKKYTKKDWLYNQYHILNKSIPEIAKEQNRDKHTIYDWLKKLNIKIRSVKEAVKLKNSNNCTLSAKGIEFINGGLLGDGRLGSRTTYSAYYKHTSKYEEYLKYISNILIVYNIKGKIFKYYDKKLDVVYYQYESSPYVELKELQTNWYDNRKKVVPKDIQLTPLVCSQWYIGDGCLGKTYNKNSITYNIVLCTMGFSIIEVLFLSNILNNLGFKTHRRPRDNVIYISAKSVKDFLRYVGDSPLNCYKYKWSIS